MQINLPVPALILLCVATTLVIVSNLIFYSILGEVNGKRGQDSQISMLFIGFRLSDVLKAHRELFPQSRKRLAACLLFGAGAIFMLSIFFTGHEDPNLIR
jgi:hypothetical protein